MNIKVLENKAELGKSAADIAAQKITAAIDSKGEARVIFASAASQFEFLAALIAHKEIDWTKVSGFHLDEYVGLSANHPASFRRFLKERLLKKLPCAMKSFTFVNGDSPDTELECTRLATALREKPIDLACIGIGENGHIAFNDPPADFETKEAYAIVQLDNICRQQQVGEGWFPNLEAVPTHAFSMTVPQILTAKTLLVVVPDARKAAAVKHTVEDAISPLVPATALRNHPDCTLFLDPPAAALLNQ